MASAWVDVKAVRSGILGFQATLMSRQVEAAGNVGSLHVALATHYRWGVCVDAGPTFPGLGEAFAPVVPLVTLARCTLLGAPTCTFWATFLPTIHWGTLAIFFIFSTFGFSAAAHVAGHC